MFPAIDLQSLTSPRPSATPLAVTEGSETGDSFMALLSLLTPTGGPANPDEAALSQGDDATTKDPDPDGEEASILALWSPFLSGLMPPPTQVAQPLAQPADTAIDPLRTEGPSPDALAVPDTISATTSEDLPPFSALEAAPSGRAALPQDRNSATTAQPLALGLAPASPPASDHGPALGVIRAGNAPTPSVSPTPSPVAAAQVSEAALQGPATASQAVRRGEGHGPALRAMEALARPQTAEQPSGSMAPPAAATAFAPTEPVAAQPAPVVSEPAFEPTAPAGVDTSPVATDQTDWEQRVVDLVTSAMTEDGAVIDISLTPETLGNVEVRVEMREGRAEVSFLTETREAARLFTQAEARLSDLLARQGLDLSGQNASSRQDARPQGQPSAGTVAALEDPVPMPVSPLDPQGRLNLIA